MMAGRVTICSSAGCFYAKRVIVPRLDIYVMVGPYWTVQFDTMTYNFTLVHFCSGWQCNSKGGFQKPDNGFLISFKPVEGLFSI
mgnify:CR=1 FL=1